MPTIKRLKKRTRSIDTFKDAERHRFYGTRRWARMRALKLAITPLCEMCARHDVVRAAEDVHHIVSFMSSDDPAQRIYLFYDFGNLMSLCKECHGKIHTSRTTK